MSTFENIMSFDYNLKNNHLLVEGFGEEGRDAWFEPVVGPFVVSLNDFSVIGINDSKKIKKEEVRIQLSKEIKEKAVAYGIGILEAEGIGIQDANFKASILAFEHMNYNIEGLIPLINGNYKGIEIDNYKSIVKGDSTSAAIVSASNVAKNKHLEPIANFGLIKWHRSYFCKKALERIGGVSTSE